MIAESTITCPKCGHQATEEMPRDACQFFYVCKGCGERLKPLPGDCCVFCSYGSVPCPPIQVERAGGPDVRLTDEQVAEVKRRLADPNPKFVTLEEVRERFARRRA
jgi:hypothetical protein